ncbi:hypothetical protein [Halosegnis sp.]|uniref:hypothetical protein n=1 Tax=Halosegnis sp. TaxID=2864959 RepID=UPI0035D3E835
MGDEPTVPVRCEECGTETRVPLTDVADAIERHNTNRHDGEQVAGVDEAVREHIADLAANDLGLTD